MGTDRIRGFSLSRTIATTAPNAARLGDLSDKLEGYPAQGVHFGVGVHVLMPGSWDGTGPVPPGWSSYRGAVVGGEFRAANGDTWLGANGPAQALTSVERTELIGLLALGRVFTNHFDTRFY